MLMLMRLSVVQIMLHYEGQRANLWAFQKFCIIL